MIHSAMETNFPATGRVQRRHQHFPGSYTASWQKSSLIGIATIEGLSLALVCHQEIIAIIEFEYSIGVGSVPEG
jgi:hypothetical protein